MDIERLKQEAAATGTMIGEKVRDTAETAKLKMEIAAKKREINKLYAALGRVYYAAHQKEEDLPEAVMFRGIRTAESELAQLRETFENRSE